MLALDAGSKLFCRSATADPLSSRVLASTLTVAASVAALPLTLLQRAKQFLLVYIWPLVRPAVRRVSRFLVETVDEVFRGLYWFATEMPVLSIPVVIACVAFTLWSLATDHPTAAILRGVIALALAPLAPVLALGAWVWASVVALSALESLSDATFAITLLVTIQIIAWKLIHDSLGILRVRTSSSNTPIELDELRAIAATMVDARQCAQCAFGPVDHSGCGDLGAHHGNVRIARDGGRDHISNACPRCAPPRLSPVNHTP